MKKAVKKILRPKKAKNKDVKIIVGLGNPGFRYRNTRHNAGFLVIKALAKKHSMNLKKKGFGGAYGIGRILGQEVMLFEPLSYMNLSGSAVKSICSAKLDEKKDLLVISDDVNLPLGKIRMRESGSSGGHNGLQSLVETIGPDFARLRIGVGSAHSEEDLARYVLSSFPRAERSDLSQVIEKASEAIEMWLREDINAVMGRYNNNS